MDWAIGAWIVVLALGVLYSAKFSYRDVLDRPWTFPQSMLVLGVAEILLLVIVLVFAVRRGLYAFGGAVLGLSFLTPRLARKYAYHTELRRMAKVQVEGNQMEWKQALEVAKILLDIQIKDGRKIA